MDLSSWSLRKYQYDFRSQVPTLMFKLFHPLHYLAIYLLRPTLQQTASSSNSFSPYWEVVNCQLRPHSSYHRLLDLGCLPSWSTVSQPARSCFTFLCPFLWGNQLWRRKWLVGYLCRYWAQTFHATGRRPMHVYKYKPPCTSWDKGLWHYPIHNPTFLQPSQS